MRPFTSAQIAMLASIHVGRYQYRVELAKEPDTARFFNFEECSRLLKLWQSVQAKQEGPWEDFTEDEVDEMMDAVASGELGPEVAALMEESGDVELDG